MRFWGVLGVFTWGWGLYFGLSVPHGVVCAAETTPLVVLGGLMMSLAFVLGPLTRWIES